MEDSDNQENIKIDKRRSMPHLWKKGQSGNPAGRPKGKTMKEWAKEYLARMTDEERDAWLDGIPKEVIWKMSEGAPVTNSDITTNGESINPVLIKFIDADNRDTGGVQETV